MIRLWIEVTSLILYHSSGMQGWLARPWKTLSLLAWLMFTFYYISINVHDPFSLVGKSFPCSYETNFKLFSSLFNSKKLTSALLATPATRGFQPQSISNNGLWFPLSGYSPVKIVFVVNANHQNAQHVVQLPKIWPIISLSALQSDSVH